MTLTFANAEELRAWTKWVQTHRGYRRCTKGRKQNGDGFVLRIHDGCCLSYATGNVLNGRTKLTMDELITTFREEYDAGWRPKP